MAASSKHSIMTRRPYTRREFMGTMMAGIAMGALYGCRQEDTDSGIPVRPLGSTGEKVSIISLGGWDIGNVDDKDKAISIMHEAIDHGVTLFDNSWDYHRGGSEVVMGRALAEPSRRDQVFLMTKVCARDYAGAKKHLEDSLRRLQTDRIDLWQFHGIQWDDDPVLIFDPENGAIKAALEAKQQGKIRYIGFTGHKDPKYHLAMLNRDFEWDNVQMPLNVLDAHYLSFQYQVLPKVVERGYGVLGMKGLAAQNGIIVRELGISAETARRFTLSLPISSLICGIQSRENLLQDMEMARNFQPLTEEEIQDLATIARPQADAGQFEEYKIGNYGCDWHHNQMQS